MITRLRQILRAVLGNRLAAGAWVLLVAVAGGIAYALVLDRAYPIRFWLIWNLAVIWGWAGVLNIACASVGQFVIARVLRAPELPALESAVFAMAVGIVVFVLSMYAAGVLGWYTRAFALLIPAVFVAIGAREGLRLARRLLSGFAKPLAGSLWHALVVAFGVLCVAIVYLGVLSPDALNYDSAWYHLTVSQDYAREGRIVAFLGDYNKNVPQLHSLVNTWSFLVPGLDQPPLRWMLCLHVEFTLFLWTLLGVAAAIRALTGDGEVRGAWATFFLFPIIFVYDHNLGGASDHVCAFFTPPLVLAALRVYEDFSPGPCVLLAFACGGALLTKYQAAYLFPLLGVVLSARWLWLLAEHYRVCMTRNGDPRIWRSTLFWSPALIVVVGALVVSPHFIRNMIFFRNPIYPFAQSLFTSTRPQVPNGPFYFEYIHLDYAWRPHGTLVERLVHACKLFVLFSFEPHYSFTKNVPVFGSLFTLLLPTLPFVKHRTRIGLAAAIGSGALLVWGFVFNVDRNLQVFMPILVSVTGALLVETWRLGLLARLGLVPLIGLQGVWGGDALFYSSHDRIRSAMDLVRSGFEGQASVRFQGYRSIFRQIGNALPKDALVLLHTSHVSLGIDRRIILDWTGFQGLIGYSHVHTPRELFDYYRSLGVTHLLEEWHERHAPSKQEEVVWNALTREYTPETGRYGNYILYKLPDTPPPVEGAYRVAVVGLHGYSDGIYPVERLETNEYLPEPFQVFNPPAAPLPPDGRALADFDAVLVGGESATRWMSAEAREALGQRFAVAFRWPQFALYLRKERVRRAE